MVIFHYLDRYRSFLDLSYLWSHIFVQLYFNEFSESFWFLWFYWLRGLSCIQSRTFRRCLAIPHLKKTTFIRHCTDSYRNRTYKNQKYTARTSSNMSEKLLLGPRGPLGTPLSVRPSVRKKNLHHLYSLINHHRTTVNLSNHIFCESS